MSGKIPIDRLGRYEIVRELGKGAMGIVYLGRDPVIGRLVALKTVRPTIQGEDDSDLRDFQERFLREAQAAGSLSHPNIVTIHDVGEDEELQTTFLAMEYIEGKNLKACLAEREPLALSDIVEIASQVAEALDYAHRKGIVHRDVKPANIIITTEGRVKIADFGIARIASSSLTTTGRFLGTPKYMSPEQVTGSAVDGRSDLFSLGMVLYEMLTRRIPFQGDNMTTISYKIAHEEFVPPSEIVRGLPPEFDQIVARSLAKEPWNRYQRGQDLAADLRSMPLPGDPPPLRRLSRAGASSVTPEGLAATRPSPEEAGLRTVPHGSTPAAGILRVPSGKFPRPVSGPGFQPPSGAMAEPPRGPEALPNGTVPAGLPDFLRSRRGKLLAGGAAAILLLLALVVMLRHANDAGGFIPQGGAHRAHRARSTSLPSFLRESEESTASAEEPSAASATAAATLGSVHVIFNSSLPAGNLRIEANRKTLLNHNFKSASADLDQTVRLTPGETKFRVQLNAADGSFHGAQTVEGQIAPGQTRTLRVSLFKNHLLAIFEE